MSTLPYLKTRRIRLFISSTFRGMWDERDVLAKHVFPEIRRRCQARKIDFVEIDLRWGIPKEQVKRGEAVPLCLERIDEGKPYFLGLLGERYGSAMAPEYISIAMASYLWVKNYADRSVTELEILHALFDVGQNAPTDVQKATLEHALFYFRDPDYAQTQPEKERSHYLETSENTQKQTDLKQRLRTHACHITDYQKPNDLKSLVLEQLWALIDKDFPEGSQPSASEKENIEHDIYAYRLQQFYVPQPADFDILTTHAFNNNDKVLVVLGESGSGKSALLANWVAYYRKTHPDDFVLWHFCGSTEDSSNPIVVMQRIAEGLQKYYRQDDKIPYTPQARMKQLSPHLNQEQRRIIVIIDGLNQLEQSQTADLKWLLNSIPASIRLIVSTVPNHETWQTLQGKGKCSTLPVQPLSEPQRTVLIEGYLERYGRKLETAYLQRLVTAPQTANPLYLQIILEELRLFGIFVKLGKRIDYYLETQTIPALYQKVLMRFEADYQSWETPSHQKLSFFNQLKFSFSKKDKHRQSQTYPHFVENAMTLLWASRRGLSEIELFSFLKVPQALWTSLYLALQTALINRDGLLNFAHDYLRQAVEQQYLTDTDKKQAVHRQLADYFAQQSVDTRKLDELPYQLEQAGDKIRLQACLSEIPIFLQFMKDNRVYELLGYWQRLNKQQKMVVAYQEALAEYEKTVYGKDLAYALTQFASFCWTIGVVTESIIRLARRGVKIGEQVFGVKHPNVIVSLNTLALLLKVKGDYEGAEPLYRQALQISEQILGAQHPLTATSLDNLAGLLTAKGDYEEAEPLRRRALKIYEQVLGTQHPDTATSLNNLALLLNAKGEHEGAEPLYRQALQIHEQVLGTQHRLTATSLDNLAGLLQDKGDYEGAKSLHQQALQIYEKVLGTQHPDTAISLSNLATLLRMKGDYEEAEPLFRQALQIHEQVLGAQHPDTAQSLNNLAKLLEANSDYDEAEPLYRQAVAIAEKVLGYEHPSTIIYRKNLARLLNLRQKNASQEKLGEFRSDLPTLPSLHTQGTSESKVSRNAPCPCGSGKRYKHCCGKLADSTD